MMTEPPVFYTTPRSKRLERNKRPCQVDPTQYLGYAEAVAVKFGARGHIRDSWQYAEAVLGLVRAAKDYIVGSRARFATLAYRYMVGEILKTMKIARHANRRPAAPVRNLGGWEPAIAADEEAGWDVERLQAWLQRLPERCRRITEAYYYRHMTMDDIAIQEGMTRQGVHCALNKSLAYLRVAAGIDPESVQAVRRTPGKTLLPA